MKNQTIYYRNSYNYFLGKITIIYILRTTKLVFALKLAYYLSIKLIKFT